MRGWMRVWLHIASTAMCVRAREKRVFSRCARNTTSVVSFFENSRGPAGDALRFLDFQPRQCSGGLCWYFCSTVQRCVLIFSNEKACDIAWRDVPEKAVEGSRRQSKGDTSGRYRVTRSLISFEIVARLRARYALQITSTSFHRNSIPSNNRPFPCRYCNQQR